MKIHYKKKRLNVNLIFGVIWIIFGVTAILFFSDNFFNYGYLALGVFYFILYIFESKRQYLTITNRTISKNQLITKKINLKDIKAIKKFAGDYKLKTDTTELTINTRLIEEKSLSDLETVLKGLNKDIT